MRAAKGRAPPGRGAGAGAVGIGAALMDFGSLGDRRAVPQHIGGFKSADTDLPEHITQASRDREARRRLRDRFAPMQLRQIAGAAR